MANKETRVIKSNTLEEWRKLSNEVSLHLGDTDQLNNSLSDKTYNFVNPSSGTTIFTNVDNDSKQIRFEVGPEATLDNTSGAIILVGSPTVPASFVSGVTLFQGESSTPSFSGTIVSVSNKKILLKNSSGVFSSSASINVAADLIDSANVDRIIIESYPVGIVRVYKNSIEIAQSLLDVNGFHVCNHRGSVTLTGSPSIGSFTEGSTVYHGTTQSTQSGVESNASFWGTVLECTSTSLKLKTVSGTFSSGSIVRLLGSVDTIPAANHGAITLHDNSYGHTIELNSPTNGTDDIQIFSMDLVAALNEIQDDVGITENLTTAASNLVAAINEHDAELGTITAAAMGTAASTVSTAILEHENQIGNESIALIDSDTNTTITGALNQLHTEVGSLSLSTGLGTDLTTAVNNLNDDLVTAGSLTSLNTTAKYVVGAINEHEGDIGNMALTGLDATNISAALREIRVDTGDLGASGANLLTTATDLTLGINELHTELYTSGVSFTGLSSVNFQDAVEELRVELGNHASLGTNTTTSAVLAINELEGVIRGANVDYTLNTTSANLRDAINELESDIFNIEGGDKRTLSSLQTTDKTSIVDSINELHTNLYTSGVSFTGLVADDFKAAINELRVDIGDVTAVNMGTTASNLTGAMLELETEIDSLNTFTGIGTTLGTTAVTLAGAINEHEGDIGNMTFTGLDALNISAAIRELRTDIGDVTAANMGTTASNLTAAMLELETEIDTLNTRVEPTQAFHANFGALTVMDGLNELMTDIGDVTATNMGTTATTVVTAIKEHEDQIGNNVLTGLSATNISAGIRELRVDTGDVTATNMGTTASNLTGAVKELVDEKLDITSTTQQVITSRLQLKGDVQFTENGTNANKMTFGTGTTLDLSNASLLLPGNTSNVNIFSVSFLEVDGNVPIQGFSVDRQHVTNIADTSDVRLQWDENYADGTTASRPSRAWQLVGLNDSQISNTADIVTFYNAKDLISNKTESGIAVTWDSTNQNFDFNVNDPTLTFTGDVTGTGTLTNLGNLSIALTVQPNSVALGTDTTGNYVADVNSGTNITVTGADGEGAIKVVNLNDSITLAGNLTVNGNSVLGNEPGDTVSTSGNLTVGGNLTVNGTQTILNVETLEVEDTLILAGNNLSTEPAIGGFGIEVGPITSPSGVANGVTGAHSIVYNYATDRWEADGSLILSTATLASPTIESISYTAGMNLDFNNGSGIAVVTALNGTDIDVTITNSDKGSSQNIWKTITANTGSTVANINADTLNLLGGTSIASSIVGDTVTFNHSNNGTAGTYGGDTGTNGIVVSSLTVNAQGHVTSGTSYDLDLRYDNYGYWAAWLNGVLQDNITTGERVGFTQSTGISITYDTNDYIITNTDRGSSQNIWKTIVSNSGSTVANINADTLNLLGGTAITSSIVGDTVTFTHDNNGTAGTYGGAGSDGIVVANLTVNAQGHVTGGTAYDLDNIYTRVNDNYVSWTIQDGDTTAYTVTSGDTLQIASGGGIVSNFTADDVLTISHADTSSATGYSLDGSGTTFVQDIALTVDTYGHVTAASASLGSFTLGDGVTTVTAGNSGITLGGDTDWSANQTAASTFSVSHADTSSVSNLSVDNSGNNFIQDIAFTFDTFGHVTGATQTSATVAIGNGTQTISAGTDLATGGSFTANQFNNSSVTINHADIARSNSTTTQSPGHGSTFTVVDSITSNARGHITAVNTKTITLPADNNTIPNNGTLTLNSSTGISGSATFTADQAGASTFTVTNTDRGSSQNIWKNISFGAFGSSGLISASTNNDTLYLLQNGGISITHGGGDIINIAHADTSSQASVNNSGRTYIQDITLDGYGHITAITSATETVTDTTYSAGTGMSLSGTTFNCTVTDTNNYVNAGTYSAGTLNLTGPGLNFNVTGFNTFAGNTYSNNMDQYVRTTDTVQFGIVRSTGDVIASYTSDGRLKDNIEVIPDALNKISKLRGVSFDWNNKQDVHEGHDIGVIAQDVQAVLPELVQERADGYLAVRYEKMVALLIEGIKELKDENKELRAMIEELKSINT